MCNIPTHQTKQLDTNFKSKQKLKHDFQFSQNGAQYQFPKASSTSVPVARNLCILEQTRAQKAPDITEKDFPIKRG